MPKGVRTRPNRRARNPLKNRKSRLRQGKGAKGIKFTRSGARRSSLNGRSGRMFRRNFIGFLKG